MCNANGNQWDTCRVEKMGCKGCYYYKNKIDCNKLGQQLTGGFICPRTIKLGGKDL